MWPRCYRLYQVIEAFFLKILVIFRVTVQNENGKRFEKASNDLKFSGVISLSKMRLQMKS